MMFGLDRLKKLREKFGSPGIEVPVGEDGELREVQDKLGREIVDSTPMEPPLGYKRQPTMVEHIREMVRSERLAAEAAALGAESFEEADNFDIADEEGEMPSSPHENEFDPPVSQLLKDGAEAKALAEADAKAKAKAEAIDADDAEHRAYRKRKREQDK